MLTQNLTCSLQNVILCTKAVLEGFEEIVANKSILTEFHGETPHRARGGHVSHSNFLYSKHKLAIKFSQSKYRQD